MSKNSSGVSVVVCCYNSATRLPKTLEHLAKQQNAQAINWEVIIVDNNSTDDTTVVAQHEWAKWELSVPVRVVAEPQAGLTYARRKGVQESKYDFVLFCDDDNWLCATYVADVYDILSKDGAIGALGGWGEPVYEQIPEDWFLEGNFCKRMATGPQGDQAGDITKSRGYVYGAGMAMPRSLVWHLFTTKTHYLKDRMGKLLTGGGDMELCYLAQLEGYKIWYSDKLRFFHFMPVNRTIPDYLTKLSRGKAYSSVLLKPYEIVLRGETLMNKNLIWLRLLLPKLKHYLKSLRANPSASTLEIIRKKMSRESNTGFITSLLKHNFAIDRMVKELRDHLNQIKN